MTVLAHATSTTECDNDRCGKPIGASRALFNGHLVCASCDPERRASVAAPAAAPTVAVAPPVEAPALPPGASTPTPAPSSFNERVAQEIERQLGRTDTMGGAADGRADAIANAMERERGVASPPDPTHEGATTRLAAIADAVEQQSRSTYSLGGR